MQLTTHTDYALRTLIALGAHAPNRVAAAEIAEAYDISLDHLLKVIQRLAALGYVKTQRGKSGGATLAMAASEINLGEVVRNVEADFGVVACLRKSSDAHCSIEAACRLKAVLATATDHFLSVLDGYTLADVLKPKAKLIRLLGPLERLRSAP